MVRSSPGYFKMINAQMSDAARPLAMSLIFISVRADPIMTSSAQLP